MFPERKPLNFISLLIFLIGLTCIIALPILGVVGATVLVVGAVLMVIGVVLMALGW